MKGNKVLAHILTKLDLPKELHGALFLYVISDTNCSRNYNRISQSIFCYLSCMLSFAEAHLLSSEEDASLSTALHSICLPEDEAKMPLSTELLRKRLTQRIKLIMLNLEYV